MSCMFGNITDVKGVKVGVVTDRESVTGCTVITVEKGAVAGVSVKGGAPGTRETDLLDPLCRIEEVHAIALSGGSAFGLDTACGVARYMDENGYGLHRGPFTIPIVPGAIIFDLFIGNGKIRPDSSWGYEAALLADAGVVPEGSEGAGTGATVGKALGLASAVKSGQASLSRTLPEGLVVGVLVVANSLGDVVDKQGKLLAGPRDSKTGEMKRTLEIFQRDHNSVDKNRGPLSDRKALSDRSSLKEEKEYGENTTLAVVATNAHLSKVEVNKLAGIAHNGLSEVIKPLHTAWDGDTIFTLATGEIPCPVDLVGAVSTELLSEAVLRALFQAHSLGGVPSLKDL